MSTANQDASVHRLVDIVVEEVSLVDRAANQRRFLIVKRSDEMSEEQAQSPETGEDGATTLTPEDDAGEFGNADDAGPRSLMVEAAVEALERLTETVETLGTLTEGDVRARVGEIAAELRALSERLVEAAGVTPAKSSAPESDLTVVLESVRATLAQVSSLIDASKATKPKSAAPDPSADGNDEKEPKDYAKRGPANAARPEDDPLRMHLQNLADAVTKLALGVKDQAQRISKLEKRFGLPHSAPAQEQGNRQDEETVGWPMDLNRPFDRENVDKTISFHDL